MIDEKEFGFVEFLAVYSVFTNNLDCLIDWLQVYFTLCCAVAASAVGAFLHVLWNIGGFLTTAASLGSMIWLLSTPPFEEVSIYKQASFCAFCDSVFFFILTNCSVWLAAKEVVSLDGFGSVSGRLHWTLDWFGCCNWP